MAISSSAVYAMNDADLQLRLVGDGADAHILRAFNAFGLAVPANQLAELSAITSRLAVAHARNILQFLDALGINRGHCFERGILEDDVRRHTLLFCHLLAMVLQHLIELGVECRSSILHRSVFCYLVEVIVLHDFEARGVFHEFLAGCRQFEHTIVIYIF